MMKKVMVSMAAMFVAACILCACGGSTGLAADEEKTESTADNGESGREGNRAEGRLSDSYALVEAVVPVLPEEPGYEELEAQLDELNYDKMGSDAYNKAYGEIYDAWRSQKDAYLEAVSELRGDGVDERITPSLAEYSARTMAQLFESDQNIIYSPANLYLALAMLAETVDGDTRDEIIALLGQEEIGALRTAANSIWRSLYTASESGTTALANSLWLSDQVTGYREETLQLLAESYYASLYSVPMGESGTDRAIAAWINENTGGLLENAAGGLQTKPATVALLLSTLYFYDRWSDEFPEGGTFQEIFTASDGEEQTVEFMHKTQNVAACVSGDGWVMAELEFCNGGKMVFLLPDPGLSVTEMLQDPDVIRTFLNGVSGQDAAEDAKLLWSVPKFDVDSSLELTDALTALGIKSVFDGSLADFSPLTEFDESIAVTQVQHAARVKVDEIGCEAAAFTAIIIQETAAWSEELPEVEINLNRPFAFLVTGVKGLPLFAGTVYSLE